MTSRPQIRVLAAADQELIRHGFCALIAATGVRADGLVLSLHSRASKKR